MSRRDDLAGSSHGTQKPAPLPEALQPKRAALPEYDSDQIPVLIRLPDLTPHPQVTEAAEKGVPTKRNSIQGHDPSGLADATAKKHRKKSRRSRREPRSERHDLEAKRTASPGLWKSFPSHVVVLAILIGLTSLVYVLVQGGSGGGPAEPEAAKVASENMAENTAAQVVGVEGTPPALEAPTRDPELWPADRGQASQEPDGNQPQPTVAGRADATAVDESDPSSEIQTFTSLSSLGSAAGADRSGPPKPADAWPSTNPANAEATSAEGPQLTWQSEPAADPQAIHDVAPVQGWPPEMGGAAPSPDPSDPATNLGSQQRYPNPAGEPPTRGQDPSTSLGQIPSMRTGMWDERQSPVPSSNGVPETATFKGTVEFPQPRVDYERTRSSVY